MIVDFSVDTERLDEVEAAVSLMALLKSALNPAKAVPPLPGPAKAKAKASARPLPKPDPRQIEMSGTQSAEFASLPTPETQGHIRSSAPYTAKHVQDVTRALMNTPNGMAEAARLLGGVGALKVSEIKAERVSEYVESVQKMLDKAGSAS